MNIELALGNGMDLEPSFSMSNAKDPSYQDSGTNVVPTRARARRDKDQCNEPKIQPLVKNKNATSSNATLPNTINGQYKITVIGAACECDKK